MNNQRDRANRPVSHSRRLGLIHTAVIKMIMIIIIIIIIIQKKTPSITTKDIYHIHVYGNFSYNIFGPKWVTVR